MRRRSDRTVSSWSRLAGRCPVSWAAGESNGSRNNSRQIWTPRSDLVYTQRHLLILQVAVFASEVQQGLLSDRKGRLPQPTLMSRRPRGKVLVATDMAQ